MTKIDLPASSYELIARFLPNYENRDDVKRLEMLTKLFDGELLDEQIKAYDLNSEDRGVYEAELSKLNDSLFKEALMSFHYAMLGKREKQIYTPVFSACTGTLNSEHPMVCIPSYKYKEVDLCLKAGWNYPIATIKLYNTNRLIDANKTFEDATKLGYEITRRWNAFLPEGGEE